MREKERGCGEIEPYMMQTEDKGSVKKYLGLLDEQGLDEKKSEAVRVFREIDRAGRYFEMILGESGRIWDRIGKLRDGKGKNHAIHAITAAQEKLDAAREAAARMDALIEKGAGDSVARFRRGTAGALEHPFPLIAAEMELKNIMDCLAGAFAAVDIGIGRIEETEGMACKNGHYRNLADGALWEGGAGEQAWLSVLWPMRSLEKLMISAQDAVYDAACRVDGMRPKAHSVIKKHTLVPGVQWAWEKERKWTAEPASGRVTNKTGFVRGREYMEGQTGSLRIAEDVASPKAKEGFMQQKGHGKPSLRKRLKIAREKSHKIHDKGGLQEWKGRIKRREEEI